MKKNNKLMLFVLLFSISNLISGQTITPEDGNWSERNVKLTNTSQAEIMVRVGDIDNLNFGWPASFDPFSGNNTPAHAFPWTVNNDDPAGTDRVMVITSYVGSAQYGRDGYSQTTSRPENNVTPIKLTYDLAGATVYSVIMQVFVDDFQASVWKAKYTVTIDSVRVPFVETIINSLVQTGPIGKMISVNIPKEYINLFEDGEVKISFDDLTTGAGDGYAIDFVKLLINPKTLGQYAKINGTITTFGSGTPIENVKIIGNGIRETFSDSDGKFTLDSLPPGIISVRVYKEGYGSQFKNINLAAGSTGSMYFQMATPAPILTSISQDTSQVILDLSSPFTITFNEEMDTTTFNTSNVILSDKNHNLSGKFLKNLYGFTFTPDSQFVKNMTYTFTITSNVTNKSGITLDNDYIWIYKTQSTTGFSNNMFEFEHLFYPNPVKKDGVINLQLNSAAEISIMNTSGIVIYNINSEKNYSNNITVDLSDNLFLPGIYLIEIKTGNQTKIQKLIII